MSEAYPHLLHPEQITGAGTVPGIASTIGRFVFARPLERRAAEVAKLDDVEHLPLGVIINARQRRCPDVLREDNFGAYEVRIPRDIANLVEDIEAQEYPKDQITRIVAMIEPEVEISDSWRKPLKDVEFVRVNPDANQAQAFGAVAKCIGSSCEITMTTEAGARYATNQAFRAAAYWIGHGAVGVYGNRFANENASLPESVLYGTCALVYGNIGRPVVNDELDNKEPLAIDRAAFSQEILLKHHFDARYGRGGFDAAWHAAMRRMQPKQPIVRDSALSIQYAHGLSGLALADLMDEWQTYQEPNEWPVSTHKGV